jgi:hypothetical protein
LFSSLAVRVQVSDDYVTIRLIIVFHQELLPPNVAQ